MEQLIITTIDELTTLLRNIIREQVAPLSPTPKRDNISLDEAVDLLKEIGCPVSKKTLYKLTSKSRIPYKKFCGKLVFSRKELQTWALQNIIEITDTSDAAATLIRNVRRKRNV